MRSSKLLAVSFVLVALALRPGRAAEPIVSAPATADGIITYTIDSEYQHGPNRLDVLLPKSMEAGKKYPVVYVLPVAKGPDEDRKLWGTGLDAIHGKDLSGKPGENLADKYGIICVFPVFDATPWYGDNLADRKVRHESYLLKVVVPLIEKNYPAIAEPRGRLLLGFSKSGWGAVSLLLRHPDIFGRAAAWDAPLMVHWPGNWGIAEHFGSKECFAPYDIPNLLNTRAEKFKDGKRLIIMGYGNFRDFTLEADAKLTELHISHEFRDGPRRQHHWCSGWVPEAVELLVKPARGAE